MHKTLAAQQRLRKLQQLQRLARPAPRGSNEACDNGQRLSRGPGSVGSSYALPAGRAPGGRPDSGSNPDVPLPASAEGRSLEDILRHASALLAGPCAWDPAAPASPTCPDPAPRLAPSDAGSAAGQSVEDECVDALIQRARRLLQWGLPEDAPAGAAAASVPEAAPAWARPWASAAELAGEPAEPGPTAADNALAFYVAHAERRGAADRAWDEGLGPSRHDATCSVGAAPAAAEPLRVGGSGLGRWRTKLEHPGQCRAAPAAQAATSDAEAWQHWLVHEVSSALPCLLVASVCPLRAASVSVLLARRRQRCKELIEARHAGQRERSCLTRRNGGSGGRRREASGQAACP